MPEKFVKVVKNQIRGEVKTVLKWGRVALVVLLSLAVLTGCAAGLVPMSPQADLSKLDRAVLEGNTEFAFDLFREVNREDREKNVFISPLSVSLALTMTYQGARGTTQAGMAEALNYQGVDLEALNETYRQLLTYLAGVDKDIELRIGNSIWVREGEDIQPAFLEVNKNVFRAEVAELDFSRPEAAATINGWIAKATAGKIDKMLEGEIPPHVIMYLINAIYFRGQWAEQFDPRNTFPAEFRAGTGLKQQVQMMSKFGRAEYGEGEDYRVVKLPYGKGKTAMYVVLPGDDVEINAFIESLDRAKWEEIRQSTSTQRDVVVQLPRFKMEYGVKLLNDSLAKLGMAEAFTDRADFSGIRDDVYISRVMHKAVIEVNEEGSEAAGATVVEVVETAALEPLRFIADRPFVFLIAEEETGTILFMGKMWSVE
ncbi:MAG TPA: serpin family protein [Clostridia bacterium]|nr:serpin family protein [Clostridia bacterium]